MLIKLRACMISFKKITPLGLRVGVSCSLLLISSLMLVVTSKAMEQQRYTAFDNPFEGPSTTTAYSSWDEVPEEFHAPTTYSATPDTLDRNSVAHFDIENFIARVTTLTQSAHFQPDASSTEPIQPIEPSQARMSIEAIEHETEQVQLPTLPTQLGKRKKPSTEGPKYYICSHPACISKSINKRIFGDLSCFTAHQSTHTPALGPCPLSPCKYRCATIHAWDNHFHTQHKETLKSFNIFKLAKDTYNRALQANKAGIVPGPNQPSTVLPADITQSYEQANAHSDQTVQDELITSLTAFTDIPLHAEKSPLETQQKKKKCSHVDCRSRKPYTNKTDLIIHQSTHNPVPTVCPFCAWTHTILGPLRKHLKDRHEDALTSCGIQPFTLAQALYNAALEKKQGNGLSIHADELAALFTHILQSYGPDHTDNHITPSHSAPAEVAHVSYTDDLIASLTGASQKSSIIQ